MSPPKSILIVDDHPLLREGLRAIIASDNGFMVVGEAGNANDGYQLAKQLLPDIAVVDISLPDQSGIHLTRKIRETTPNTRVLIVSMHTSIDYITEALQAGAIGYIVKESATGKLMQGLHAVARGDYFLDSSMSQELVERLMKPPEEDSPVDGSGYDRLTSREQEIMRMLAEGLSKAQIAERLSISIKTVENHRSNIMKKLELSSAMDLVRYAAKLGLIDIDMWKK